jgi:choline dehydrogenase-like flavoprotein
MDIPALAHYLQAFNINWKFKTKKSQNYCLAMENYQCNLPQGKVLGGTSVLNYMIYTRGHKRDYDNWERLGCEGWNYQNVSYYFRKMENNIAEGLTKNYYGKKGPLKISNVNFKTKASEAFIKAGSEMGFPQTDYNGPKPIGFSFFQTTTSDSLRFSANSAYLRPAANRKNLHVKKLAFVTKILIDKNKKAYGVKFTSQGKDFNVFADKEVILSAGALNSPKILMLSGIGPKKHLSEFGIETISHLPVGYNLIDHLSTLALTFLVNSTTISPFNGFKPESIQEYFTQHSGMLSTTGACEAFAFINTENFNDRNSRPDMEYIFVGGSIVSDTTLKSTFGIHDDFYENILSAAGGSGVESIMIWPMLLRPKSRGRVKLKSTNPFDQPEILANYFSDSSNYDMRTMIKAIRFMKKIENTKAFKQIGAKLLRIPIPICDQYEYDSYSYWECFIKHYTITIYHYSGTVRMGIRSDPRSVVDNNLKVIGIKNLRVVDASVMPEIPSAHLNAPTIMIAEKASDIIRNDWKQI